MSSKTNSSKGRKSTNLAAWKSDAQELREPMAEEVGRADGVGEASVDASPVVSGRTASSVEVLPAEGVEAAAVGVEDNGAPERETHRLTADIDKSLFVWLMSRRAMGYGTVREQVEQILERAREQDPLP